MNKIWTSIIIVSLLYGLISGNTSKMYEALMDSFNDTIFSLFKIGGLIIFYNGLFQIAIDSGIISTLSKVLKKTLSFLFPKVPKNCKALEYISSNIVANLLGLGIASTPMALKALNELKILNQNKNEITSSMVTFILLNISAFTILPLTIISLREMYYSNLNLKILPLLILATFINTIFSIVLAKFIERKGYFNEK